MRSGRGALSPAVDGPLTTPTKPQPSHGGRGRPGRAERDQARLPWIRDNEEASVLLVQCEKVPLAPGADLCPAVPVCKIYSQYSGHLFDF